VGCCQSARGSPISSNQTAKPRHTGTFSSASSGHAVDFKIIRRRMNFCMPSSKQVSTTNYCFRYVQVIVPSTLPNLCLFYWLPLHVVAMRHCQLGLMSLTAVHVWQLTDPTAMWRTVWRCWRATVLCTLQGTYRSDCMPVTTAQLVTILWTVTRPQKIHQHQHPFLSFKAYSPTSKLCAPSVLFIRYIRECESVFSFAIKDAVHKPNLKSTLVNVITHNVESPSTLCAIGNHFVLQLFVRSRIYFHLKCVNENVLQSMKRKNRKASKIMNV